MSVISVGCGAIAMANRAPTDSGVGGSQREPQMSRGQPRAEVGKDTDTAATNPIL